MEVATVKGKKKFRPKHLRPRTIFEAIEMMSQGSQSEKNETDLGFRPNEKSFLFMPTDAPVGSVRKMNVMQRRLELGLPLFHPEDNPTAQEICRSKK